MNNPLNGVSIYSALTKYKRFLLYVHSSFYPMSLLEKWSSSIFLNRLDAFQEHYVWSPSWILFVLSYSQKATNKRRNKCTEDEPKVYSIMDCPGQRHMQHCAQDTEFYNTDNWHDEQYGPHLKPGGEFWYSQKRRSCGFIQYSRHEERKNLHKRKNIHCRRWRLINWYFVQSISSWWRKWNVCSDDLNLVLRKRGLALVTFALLTALCS